MLHPLSFGEILDGAFTLYRRHFTTLLTTALLAAIPLSLTGRLMEGAMLADAATTSPSAVAGVLIAIPLTALLWALLWGALTHQLGRQIGGETSSLREGYARALRVLPRFVFAGIIVVLITTAFVLVLAIAAGLLAIPIGLSGVPPWAATAYAVLTTLLVTVALAAAMASFFAIAAAVVVEDLGPWAATRRSHRLASGARMRIIGVLLVSSIITLLPTLGLMFLVGVGSAAWDVEAAATLGPVQVALQQLVTIISTALTTPFMVGCVTLLYFDRRVRTEGYDLELAAEALADPAVS